MSWYLRGGLARVGGARRQVLHRLQPRHHQYAGDVCSTEQWRPWCHGPVALAAARVMHSGRFVVIKKSQLAAAAAAGCALCSPCRHSANAQPEHQTRMTLRLQVWIQSPRWIQVGNWRGGWGWPWVVRTERDRLRVRGRMRCAQRPPPPSYWGMFYYRGHHWRALKRKICSVSYLWQRIHDMMRDFKFKTIFWERNLCEWLDQAIKRANDAKRAIGSVPQNCGWAVVFSGLSHSIICFDLCRCLHWMHSVFFLCWSLNSQKMFESSSLEVSDSNILCYATEWRLFFWHVTIRWQVAANLQDQYR
jgi:hypothetical protein